MERTTFENSTISPPGPVRARVRAWIPCGILLALAACLAPFDLAISQWLNPQTLPGDLRRILGLSEFFAHGFGVAVILLVIWNLTPHWRRYLPRLAACAFLPGVVVNLIKFSIGRCRPGPFGELAANHAMVVEQQTWAGWFPALQQNAELQAGYAIQSFPSGHAATAIGLAIGLSWLVPRGRLLFFTLAMMACLQRIAYQAHWTSDVLVGAAIAMAISGWLTHSRASQKLFHRWEQQNRQVVHDTAIDETSRAA